MVYDSSRESLSSMLTFIYKFILPISWIGVFGIGTVETVYSEPEMASVFIVGLLIGCVILYFFCLPLKSVETDGLFLYVSNYIKTIQVPISKIEKVTEAPFINIHPVWIKFKTPTEFGQIIIFMPYFSLKSVFMMSHPVVTKLKELAKLY